MKRLILALVAALALSVPASAFNWVSNASEVARSVVKLSAEAEGYGRYTNCTGFSIDERRQLVLTAAHCLDQTTQVDGFATWPVFIDAEDDLAVLQTVGVSKPALKPGVNPKVGEELAAIGYGYGLNEPVFKVVKVAATGIELEGFPGKWLMVTPSYIGGMSGGPVIDEGGKVVSIVQLSTRDSSAGFGRKITDILAKTRQFWQYRS